MASLGESIEYMLDFTHNKKYDKKIFIISSSQSELGSVVESESMQVASIRKSLMENEINLDIILVDDSNVRNIFYFLIVVLSQRLSRFILKLCWVILLQKKMKMSGKARTELRLDL